jgi:DNA repair protein RadC
MKSLPIHERPREKLLSYGARVLSDVELLALLLGSGCGNSDVISISKKVIGLFDSNDVDLKSLTGVEGVGVAKASVILAALEFARRRIAPDGVKIRSAEDVVPLVQHLADRKQETFICVSLSGAYEVIASRVVTIGLANVCQVHPREVFADPLVDRACAIIVAHNHPSGDLTPSNEDKLVTERLSESARLLGITLLDHIIFSKRGFCSFAKMGLI